MQPVWPNTAAEFNIMLYLSSLVEKQHWIRAHRVPLELYPCYFFFFLKLLDIRQIYHNTSLVSYCVESKDNVMEEVWS